MWVLILMWVLMWVLSLMYFDYQGWLGIWSLPTPFY
jgi:hypothetical protein